MNGQITELLETAQAFGCGRTDSPSFHELVKDPAERDLLARDVRFLRRFADPCLNAHLGSDDHRQRVLVGTNRGKSYRVGLLGRGLNSSRKRRSLSHDKLCRFGPLTTELSLEASDLQVLQPEPFEQKLQRLRATRTVGGYPAGEFLHDTARLREAEDFGPRQSTSRK
jgi:hypothetical protein